MIARDPVSRPDPVELLHGLVRIASPTGQEERACRWLAEQMEKLGLRAGLDGAGNAVGIAGTGTREILLLGHIDTVPGEIPVRLEGGVLHGRGSVDAKGALAALAMAASRFAADPRVKIVVVGAVREEGDSGGARHVVESGAYRPVAVIVGEPSGTDGITIGYRGSARILYRAETESSHAASGMPSAPDAALSFVNALRMSLKALPDPRFEGVTVGVRRIDTRSDGLGTSCEALLDVRFPPGMDASAVREGVEKSAVSGHAVVLESEEPVLADKNNALVRAFLKGIRAEGLEPRFVKKTGTSDMNIAAPAYAVPAVAYGPGDSRLDHTPHEALPIEEYLRSIAVLERVLESLGAGP